MNMRMEKDVRMCRCVDMQMLEFTGDKEYQEARMPENTDAESI